MARLDERVEAHIDGLRVAGDEGWRLVEEGLAREEPGEAFAAAVLALESGERDRLDQVLAAVRAAPEMFRGLTSACGWVAPETLQGTALGLLNGGSAFLQRVGIAACALHRLDPGPPLEAALADADPLLRARAARASGELGRRDLTARLIERLGDEDEACRFWAAWSAVRLGSRREALELLKSLPLAGARFAERAVRLAVRAMTPEAAQSWLSGLVQHSQFQRAVIVGAGARGDPFYIPWLIERMAEPELARVAGEAFAMITGVDLAYQDLDGEWPEGFEAGPTESPEDEDVALDPDEDLAWPELGLLQRWWEDNKGRFPPGARMLLGQPVSEGHCRQVLLDGFQRQRTAAALELALMRPEAPLVEIRAPGKRQQWALAGAAA